MTLGSLLLILIAVVLLAAGLAGGSGVLLVASLAASLLAAAALVIGSRQVAGSAGDGEGDYDPVVRPSRAPAAPGPGFSPGPGFNPDAGYSSEIDFGHGADFAASSPTDDGRDTRPVHTTAAATVVAAPAAEARGRDVRDGRAGREAATYVADRHGDPGVEIVAGDDASRLAHMSTPVVVVDGRPHYHLPGCPHLHGHVGEPVPVSEAVELGFTPCRQCEPVTALLGG